MSEPTDDLARWAALAEAATPGPWVIKADDAAGFYGNADDYDVVHPLTEEGHTESVAVGGLWEDGGPHVGACVKPDAAFIAEARTAVPRLLALVAAQAGQIAELRGAVDVAETQANNHAEDAILLERAVKRVRALCDETEHWYAILAGGNPSGATVGTSEVRAALDGEATP